MPLRPTMATLITRVRRLIQDPTTPVGTTYDLSTSPPVWPDEDIQDALDSHQCQVRYLPLRPEGTRPPGGGFVLYLDYYADEPYWEDASQLTDGSYNILDPVLYDQDSLTGHWTFTVTQNWPLHLTGKRFDIYAAAADMLDQWAASLKEDFDFEAHLTKYDRSQKQKMCLASAAMCRRQQQPQMMTMVRSDRT